MRRFTTRVACDYRCFVIPDAERHLSLNHLKSYHHRWFSLKSLQVVMMEIYRSTSVTSQPSGRDMQRDVSGEINIEREREREEEESNKISLIEEKLKFHFQVWKQADKNQFNINDVV